MHHDVSLLFGSDKVNDLWPSTCLKLFIMSPEYFSRSEFHMKRIIITLHLSIPPKLQGLTYGVSSLMLLFTGNDMGFQSTHWHYYTFRAIWSTQKKLPNRALIWPPLTRRVFVNVWKLNAICFGVLKLMPPLIHMLPWSAKVCCKKF